MNNLNSSSTSIFSEKSKIFVLSTCFNEEEVINDFIDRVLSTEMISNLVLVDDGSRDSTVEKIKKYKKQLINFGSKVEITIIELSRNFGKEAAILAGLDYVKGQCDALVIIDCDLQDPPELIPKMIGIWREGAEIVTAIRDNRRKETFFKSSTARWFYRIFNRMVDSIQLKDGAGDYRLLSFKVIKALTDMRESSRFTKALIPWTGYKSIDIKYQRDHRYAGKTSWSPIKLWRYALDAIFSFSPIPLKIWTFLGLLVSILSLVYALFIFLNTLINGVSVPGYASIIITSLFLGGIQLIGIGVVGEYIMRIYLDTKSRPHYFIRSIKKLNNLDKNE